MTDLVLWILVVLIALIAGWLTLPRSAALDWERLFKLALVTGLRGPIEAREGTPEEWIRAGRERVWYHPASRGLLQKLRSPESYDIPVPALAGERALLEKLAAVEGGARLKTLFEGGDDELLYDDPTTLGPEWDLAKILGPGAGWDDLAAWKPTVPEVLVRRAEHHTWAVLGDAALFEALAEVLGDRVKAIESLDELAPLVPKMSDRLVLVARGDTGLFPHLHKHVPLRDQVAAVVGIDLDNDPAWLAEHFDNEAFDTELNRITPYFHVAFLEGEPDLEAFERSLLQIPAVPDTLRVVVEPIDLGVLPGPAADCPPDLLARSLLIVVSARLALG